MSASGRFARRAYSVRRLHSPRSDEKRRGDGLKRPILCARFNDRNVGLQEQATNWINELAFAEGRTVTPEQLNAELERVMGTPPRESKGAIGYWGLQELPDTITDYDINRPIYDKEPAPF